MAQNLSISSLQFAASEIVPAGVVVAAAGIDDEVVAVGIVGVVAFGNLSGAVETAELLA